MSAAGLAPRAVLAYGALGLPAALAVMLGADIGTALMVQVFSLNLAWLAPLLIVAGVIVYLSQKNERAGQIGKIVIKLPLPPGTLPTLWHNDDGFARSYLVQYRNAHGRSILTTAAPNSR